MAKPAISVLSMMVLNVSNGKPSRFYLKGTDFGANPIVKVNGYNCKKATPKDGVPSVLLHFHDHPQRMTTPGTTGEVNVTISVNNGVDECDPVSVIVYVDDDPNE
jgi:hypothetical protein